jgi:hypothetical protein
MPLPVTTRSLYASKKRKADGHLSFKAEAELNVG